MYKYIMPSYILYSRNEVRVKSRYYGCRRYRLKCFMLEIISFQFRLLGTSTLIGHGILNHSDRNECVCKGLLRIVNFNTFIAAITSMRLVWLNWTEIANNR